MPKDPRLVDQDDSVTRRGDGRPDYSGKSVTKRGEDLAKEQREKGRVGERSTARYVTGVGPQDPIDKKSPNLR